MKLPQLRDCHIISEEQPTVLPIAAGKQPQRQNMFYVLDTLAKLRETQCENWAAEVAAFQQRFPFEYVKINVQEWLAYINTDELCVFDKVRLTSIGTLGLIYKNLVRQMGRRCIRIRYLRYAGMESKI